MSDNWIVGNLQSSMNTWNDKMTEIWSLITTTPQSFRGGAIWTTIVTINDAMKAIGYGLLVLFFAMSIFQSAASFRDFQRPEFALRHFIRFVLAKVAVGSAMEIMTAIFSVCGGIVQTVMGSVGSMASASVSVPQEIVDAIEDVGFLASIPCQFSILRYQQEDGLNTALPYGLRRIKTTRTLTTESTAVLMPFRVQEIQDAGGIYYGVNAVSKNLLICNRKRLLNPHGFILGVSDSGKSFSMKEAITFIALSTNDDIIIIDAEREYGDLIRALGGAVIEISPNSPHHINPLEIARGYGTGENPVAMKSELLMSICEQQMGAGQLGAFHKSIIDRCTAAVYHDLIASGGKARQPILSDWRNEVKRQPEREAEELALASELFVEGSLNMFAHDTNVDIANRIISFDLYEMGEQLKPTALNVTLETIQNRVAANRLAGKYTWVFVDEVYLFFRYHYSAQFLYKCWKRFRKYAAAMTAATQNVEECLRSDTARLMFANSEFLVLLNQAATDRAELAKLLNISTNQMSYITSAEAGHGLIRVGGSIVPFANEFPRNTELYRLMTTTGTPFLACLCGLATVCAHAVIAGR